MKLRKYRLSIDKTQEKCAEELDITKEYFSDIERGKHLPSRILSEKIIKWSENNVTYSDLWGWDDDEKTTTTES